MRFSQSTDSLLRFMGFASCIQQKNRLPHSWISPWLLGPYLVFRSEWRRFVADDSEATALTMNFGAFNTPRNTYLIKHVLHIPCTILEA